MTIAVEPFSFSDLLLLDGHGRSSVVVGALWRWPMRSRRIMEGPFSYTAWTAYGVPVASCGILETGYAWALFAGDCRRYMVPMTRAVRRVLDLHSTTRGPVRAEIDLSYPPAVRWARFLGFSPVEDGVWEYVCERSMILSPSWSRSVPASLP